MSKSIIKRSIELFDDTTSESDTKKHKKHITSEDKSSIFTQGLSVEKRKKIITIDQIRKQQNKQRDRTEENLRKLNVLSQNQVNKEKTTSIFKRGSRCKEEPKIVENVEGTVFTEEDFAMFEREYVVD